MSWRTGWSANVPPRAAWCRTYERGSMTMPGHAMVLAAGLGLRMRPLTKRTSKPLIPVAGRSMLDRVFDRLDEAGVPNRVVNTHWLAGQSPPHLGNTLCGTPSGAGVRPGAG